MAITKTKIHDMRVADQIRQKLVHLQIDIRRNAARHKAMAQAQNPDLATLQTFVTDCANQYATHLKWVEDLRADATKWPAIASALQSQGVTDTDILAPLTDMKTVTDQLKTAPKANYSAIISACDALLATVDAPLSLWPE